MTATSLKAIISSLTGCVSFDYNNKSCGVDPFNANCFDMWYGEDCKKAENIDDVMNSPFFGGKSLNDISSKITNVEY